MDIRVPKTPKKAFNKRRKVSGLLMAQIEHLQWAALPAAERQSAKDLAKRKIRKPKTEGQAAEYIEQLTKQVLEQQAAAPPQEPPAPGPQVKPVAAARPRRRRKGGGKK